MSAPQQPQPPSGHRPDGPGPHPDPAPAPAPDAPAGGPAAPTPHGQPAGLPGHPAPGGAAPGLGPYPGAPTGAAAFDPAAAEPDKGGRDDRMRVGQELRRGVLITVLTGIGGLLLGLLWVWLAPRIPLVSDGKAVYLQDPEGEEAIGADGTFALLGLAFGVVSGALVFWRLRRGGLGAAIGLAAGAIGGSLLAWKFGVWLGPGHDIIARAKAAGTHKIFDAPLDLRAKGVLLAWPVAALAVQLGLTAWFTRPKPAPPAPWTWRPPRPGATAYPYGPGQPPPAPHPAPQPAPPPAPQPDPEPRDGG